MSAPRARARATFLADQRDGAAEALERHLTRLVSITPGATAAPGSHPAVQTLMGRLTDLIRAGEVQRCEHLDPNAPAPSFWVAGDPGLIRCQLCTVAIGGVLYAKHQHSGLACDLCGTTDQELDSARIRVSSTLILATICRQCMKPESAR